MFAVLKNIGKVSSLNASEFYLRTRLDPGGVFQRNMFLKRVRAAALQLSSLNLMRNCLKISRTTWTNRILHKYPVHRYINIFYFSSLQGRILLSFSALVTNSMTCYYSWWHQAVCSVSLDNNSIDDRDCSSLWSRNKIEATRNSCCLDWMWYEEIFQQLFFLHIFSPPHCANS